MKCPVCECEFDEDGCTNEQCPGFLLLPEEMNGVYDAAFLAGFEEAKSSALARATLVSVDYAHTVDAKNAANEIAAMIEKMRHEP